MDIVKSFEAGVALLDSKLEDNWVDEDRINLDILDIYSWENCVLGQLFGSYLEGRRWLDIPFGEGVFYGFDTTGGLAERDQLNSLWWNLITDRRDARK